MDVECISIVYLYFPNIFLYRFYTRISPPGGPCAPFQGNPIRYDTIRYDTIKRRSPSFYANHYEHSGVRLNRGIYSRLFFLHSFRIRRTLYMFVVFLYTFLFRKRRWFQVGVRFIMERSSTSITCHKWVCILFVGADGITNISF